MKALNYLAICILTFSLSAFGADSKAFETITKYIKPSIYELDKDVTVYHWTYDVLDTDKPNNKSVEKNLKAKIRDSKSIENKDKNVLGRGLYLAGDPLVTKGYGTHVIAVRLNKGSRILDLRSTNFSLDAVNEIKLKTSLQIISVRNFYDQRFISTKAESLLKAVLANEKISAVIYTYKTEPYDFCDNKTKDEGAGPALFVMNESIINFNQTYVFDRDSYLLGSSPVDLVRIENLAEHSPNTYRFNRTGKKITDIINWAKSETFACGEIKSKLKAINFDKTYIFDRSSN